MYFKALVVLVAFVISETLSWEALPVIPTGRRSQFLVLQDDGAYKFGYDTGSGHAAKQEADPSNEVQGHYFYKNSAGQNFDLKYTSGVQGFVPENLDKIQNFIKSSNPSGPGAPSSGYIPAAQSYSSPNGDDSGDYKPDNSGDYQPDDSGDYKPSSAEDSNSPSSGDASYKFNVDTPSYKRTETSDPSGNVQGSYSYNNKAGTHDLQYEAGAEKGFIARSGSLSKPNGLGDSGPQAPESYRTPEGYSSNGNSYQSPNNGASPKGPINPDGSYSFGFATNDQTREESGDPSGNVKGKFSFSNKDGNHDLSYVAGSATGFLPTGGSLANPNGLGGAGAGSPLGRTSNTPGGYNSNDNNYYSPNSGASPKGSINPDGSYSFGFATNDQTREESGDPSGNVKGKFSFSNKDGHHDLSYVAGSATGFLPTGGSLANPNGLGGASSPLGRTSNVPGGYDSNGQSPNNGASPKGPINPDGSYSFGFSTNDQTREESGDASGNVKGKFAFSNKDGNHDLSYVAGSATGFLPTGGSLANPNGLGGGGGASPFGRTSSFPDSQHYSSEPTDGQADTGDSSYKFSFDTPEYSRKEASDARGNVKGSFSFKNKAGSNDLSFVAGSATGFLPTGGSLSLPNGLTGKTAPFSAPHLGTPLSDTVEITAARSGGYSPSDNFPQTSGALSGTRTSYTVGNVKVHTYLPPSNEKHKFGYILDSQ